MQLRVEPHPAGGYVVRMAGQDAPVSRHDTEEEAEAWVARFAAASSPPPEPAQLPAARFAALPDGTQVLLRPPRPEDGEGTLVAVDPATGAVVGRLAGGAVVVDDAWAGRGLEGLLRPDGPGFSRA